MHINNAQFYELMVESHRVWDLVDEYEKTIKDFKLQKEIKKELDGTIESSGKLEELEDQLAHIIMDHKGEITNSKYLKARKRLPGVIKEKSAIHEKLSNMFMILARNNLRKPCYSGYSKDRKDDMVQRAVINMWKYHRSFGVGEDAKSKNPFSYFTTTCNRLFWSEISDNKKFSSQNRSFGFVENLFADGELTGTAIPQNVTKNQNKEEVEGTDEANQVDDYIDSNTNVEFNKIVDYDFHDKVISEISDDTLLELMKKNDITFKSIRKDKTDRFKFNYLVKELVKSEFSIIEISARLLLEINNKAIVFNILDQDNRDLLISEVMKTPHSQMRLRRSGIKPKLVRVSDHVEDLLKFYAHGDESEDEINCAI